VRTRLERDKLSIVVTVAGAAGAIIAALAMRDHVRLVDIIGLFASGIGRYLIAAARA
jgi:hypothetical protein